MNIFFHMTGYHAGLIQVIRASVSLSCNSHGMARRQYSIQLHFFLDILSSLRRGDVNIPYSAEQVTCHQFEQLESLQLLLLTEKGKG